MEAGAPDNRIVSGRPGIVASVPVLGPVVAAPRRIVLHRSGKNQVRPYPVDSSGWEGFLNGGEFVWRIKRVIDFGFCMRSIASLIIAP